MSRGALRELRNRLSGFFGHDSSRDSSPRDTNRKKTEPNGQPQVPSPAPSPDHASDQAVSDAPNAPNRDGTAETVLSPKITVTDDSGATKPEQGGLRPPLDTPPRSSGPQNLNTYQTQDRPGLVSAGISFDGRTPLETIYPPLGSKHDTRLVAIRWSYSAAKIRCDSSAVALRDDHSYVALSYHWGSEAPQCEILLNGATIKVRRTLYEALKAFIRQKVKQVWIDTLSIDQANEDDKGQQVARMHTIYSHAKKVYGWLGPAKIDQHGANGEHGMQFLTDVPQDGDQVGSEARLALSEKQHNAIVNLINRTFWKRSWIIQELSKAREAYVLCGSRELKLETFLDSLFLLNERHSNTLIPTTMMEHFRCLQHFHEQERTVTRQPQMPLVNALVFSRYSLASVPRDKIYAIAHLAHDSSRLVQTPNYVQADGVVYRQLTANLINKQGHAAVVLLARGAGIPSTAVPESSQQTESNDAGLAPLGRTLSHSSNGSRTSLAVSEASPTASPITRRRSSTGSFSRVSRPELMSNVPDTATSSPREPTWVPNWSALDDPLPPWIMGSVLMAENSTPHPPKMSCESSVLHIHAARLAIVQAVSGLPYTHGQADALRYKADAIDDAPDVHNYLPQYASEVAMKLWHAVVQIHDPSTQIPQMGHPCVQYCHANGVLGYALAKILTAKHHQGDEHSNEAVIDRWMSNNSHMRVGSKTLGEWMAEIRSQARAKTSRFNPSPLISSASNPLAECPSDFATESRLFAQGLRHLAQYKMRLAFTTTGSGTGTFEAVHRETKVRDFIYRLERCPLPVVLRSKPTEKRDAFWFIGETFLRDYISPSAFLEHNGWRNIDAAESKYRNIVIY